jgi:hypothetical protein
MKRPSVSLVIPILNEELNIENSVVSARETLDKYAGYY